MATKVGAYVNGTEAGRATATWTITEADTGQGIGMAEWPDKTVQAFGTFGAGTVVLEGSNDGTNWSALHDFFGSAISLTDTSLKLIAENPSQIRPRATAGSGMSLTIQVIGAK